MRKISMTSKRKRAAESLTSLVYYAWRELEETRKGREIELSSLVNLQHYLTHHVTLPASNGLKQLAPNELSLYKHALEEAASRRLERIEVLSENFEEVYETLATLIAGEGKRNCKGMGSDRLDRLSRFLSALHQILLEKEDRGLGSYLVELEH
jgi:hypothetical protein